MSADLSFWHIAPRYLRERIANEGLVPQPADDVLEELTTGIWMFSDHNEVRDTSSNFDVWEIKGIQPEHGSDASIEWIEGDPVWVTFETIPPSLIRRLDSNDGSGR